MSCHSCGVELEDLLQSSKLLLPKYRIQEETALWTGHWSHSSVIDLSSNSFLVVRAVRQFFLSRKDCLKWDMVSTHLFPLKRNIRRILLTSFFTNFRFSLQKYWLLCSAALLQNVVPTLLEQLVDYFIHYFKAYTHSSVHDIIVYTIDVHFPQSINFDLLHFDWLFESNVQLCGI